ncbi:MAG: hypothetical protein V7631_2728 [Massilia sp.]|jgi:hypothetical protein
MQVFPNLGKGPVKILWSTVVSMLLAFLASLFLSYAAFSPKPLFVKAGTAAVGLCFLVAFVNYAWPEKRIASKLATVFNYCAGALFLAALILGVWPYIGPAS